MHRSQLHPKLAGFGTTIFTEMSALAVATDSINLGQGFPDVDGPPEIAEVAIRAIRDGVNQYAPLPGLPELRQAVARHQHRFYGLNVDPETEIQVTYGATEAIAAALIALVGVGDEVIVLDPSYDSYTAAIAMAGATKVPVPLVHPELALDLDRLRSAVSPRTRVMLINSPHNPSGKVLGPEELAGIAEIAVADDLIVIADEVYEHLVFDGTHVPLATLPGMSDRTLTISSGGKSFSFTGWKVGWAVGPPSLVAAVRTAKQFLTFAGNGPFQLAVAAALDLPDDYYTTVVADLRDKRDLLCAGLAAAGFGVRPPDGTYFATADTRPLGYTDAVELCRELPNRCGVVAIPSSVFSDQPASAAHLVRFAFCKRTEVLREAVARLTGPGGPAAAAARPSA